MTDRVFYVDVIRAYAILLVVVSHVFAPVCAAMNSYPLAVWWVFNLLDSAIRLCVPLFVMISGKLLLGSEREEPYLHFLWRRFSRLAAPFFVWSMIYAYQEARMQQTDFSLGESLLQFLQGPTEFHLWFMYMILGLYLVAPFLRRFVRAAAPAELTALLGLWLGFLSYEWLFPGSAGSGPATTLVNYGGYFLMGYWTDRASPRLTKRRPLMLISLAIVVFNAVATYYLMAHNGGILDEKFYGGVAPLVSIYAAAFYLILKGIDYNALQSAKPWFGRLVMRFSLESYNIYLVHVFFLWLFIKGSLGFVLSEATGGNPLIGVPLTAAAILACSLGLSALLQKIPLVSRLLVTS
jgi:surface polysaccharide O-acyltransferase-like enzyme